MKRITPFSFLFLLLIIPAGYAAGPDCTQCGPYCDRTRCEALGGGGTCWFNDDPAVSAADACRACKGEITSCPDYFSPNVNVVPPAPPFSIPKRVSANLCLRDPCNANKDNPDPKSDHKCGLNPAATACLPCSEIECKTFLPPNCGKCCVVVGSECMKEEPPGSAGCAEAESRGEFYQVNCGCYCSGGTGGEMVRLCASGIKPKNSLDLWGADVLNRKDAACTECNKQCAKNCGSYAADCNGKDTSVCTDVCGPLDTKCLESCNKNPCELCCFMHCQNFEDTATACINTCKSSCEYKRLLVDSTSLIYSIAGIVGAIMIILHAVRLVTSSDDRARSEAKRSIVYVIVAFAIIALAGAMVALFTDISGAGKPATCCTGVDCQDDEHGKNRAACELGGCCKYDSDNNICTTV